MTRTMSDISPAAANGLSSASQSNPPAWWNGAMTRKSLGSRGISLRGALTPPERLCSPGTDPMNGMRSEEHTYELQSLMRISYAVFCLKKQKTELTLRIH